MKNALIDLGPLRVTAYRRLWIGQVLSGFGGQLTFVAVMFQVWDQTSSPAWTGAVGLAQALPLIVLGLFAGTLVDRFERRRIYLITTCGQWLTATVMASQLLFGRMPVGVLLVLIAVQASFGATAGPVARTVLPQLLCRDQLSDHARDQHYFFPLRFDGADGAGAGATGSASAFRRWIVSTMPTMVVSTGGSAGRNGKLASFPRTQ